MTTMSQRGAPLILPKIQIKKKAIRPSSAAAKLQTHSSFTSGLFDDVARPSTSSSHQESRGILGQRPHTQAGGPKQQWQNRLREQPRPDDTIKHHTRRLTVGAVDGIAESETIVRPGGQIQGNVQQQLKSKVYFQRF